MQSRVQWLVYTCIIMNHSAQDTWIVSPDEPYNYSLITLCVSVHVEHKCKNERKDLTIVSNYGCD